MPEQPIDARQQVLFGLRVAALRMQEVVDLAADAVEHRRRFLVGVVNAAKVVKLRRDAFLRDSLLDCDLLVPDGQAVVWAASLLGKPIPERVAGIDLFQELMALADERRLRVYLLGARQEVLDRVVVEVGRRWPGAVVVGSRNGYFTDDQAPEVAAGIAASGADMLFLGITTPKKEIFLGRYANMLDVPVLHGVGGSFDVVAGLTRRAPLRWQRMGLEWAYRLLQEPRRLWRRYLVTNTLFALLLIRERVLPRRPYARSVPHITDAEAIPVQRTAARAPVTPRARRRNRSGAGEGGVSHE